MIQKGTRLVVADNSGAKEVSCIHVVGSSGKSYAYVGDLIICAVKRAIPGGKVKKGEVKTAVIVRTAKEFRRASGIYTRSHDNAAVLIESVDDPTPTGTRVFGPVARELKERYGKILSLAPEVL